MAERTGGLRRPLANASIYSLVQQALGADRVRREVLGRYLKPVTGERVLDLGCGPAEVLALLPAVQYVGVDLSPEYIAAARERYGDHGKFICADVRSLELSSEEQFDAVISIGVLHHLDDTDAARMIRLAASALRPDGRLLTLDPGLTDAQPRAARWLIKRDRGQSVRSPAGYRALAASAFESVEVFVHHDLARVPYTHVALLARKTS